MAPSRSFDAYPQTAGNLAVLAIVDSSQLEFPFQFEATFTALTHFGVPFRVLDLATASLTADALAGCRAAVIGQEYVGASLGSAGVRTLLRAIRNGLGIVNCDFRVGDGYGEAYLEAAGLRVDGPFPHLATGSATALNIRDSSHPITWLQDGESRKELLAPVPTTRARVGAASTRVLLEADGGEPLLLASTHGQGRIVQWLVSPRIWLSQYFGHAAGLDDAWLRSIVWAARKPMLLKSMPPFFRFRFDDCQGLWRDGSDLDFVDVLHERGHVPSLSYCLRAVTSDGAARMATLSRSKAADFSPHVLEPMQSLYYGDADGEYSDARFADTFREIDEAESRLGIRHSRIVSDHDHSTSVRALPYLRARGMTNKMNVCLPGETWGSPHVDWHPAPYGSMSCAFDFQPPPADAFFVVFNHARRPFDAGRAYLDPDHFVFHRDGEFGSQKWDMLNGLTSGDGWQSNQVGEMARRLADHTRLGLDSGFFGGSITHSHFIRRLAPGEWRDLLAGADALMPRHRYEPCSYDLIADYARSKVSSVIAHADESGGRVSVTLTGESSVHLRLAMYADADIGEPSTIEADPFSGHWTQKT